MKVIQMYLDPWMLFVAALMYGVCAWWNRRAGVLAGHYTTIKILEKKRIIRIEGDEIVPYVRENT